MVTSERLLNILGLFTIERPEWTVEAAAAALNVRISTTYRYFRSLVGAGFISTYSAGRYVLGPAFIQYDRQMRLGDPLIATAAPVMERLAGVLPPQTVVLLCRLYRTQVMCVDQRVTSRTQFASSYERGRPMALFRGAASKVILAHLSLRIIKSLHSKHAPEMKDAGLGESWDDVKRALREIRARDVFHTEGELHRGMQGVAAPIFSADAAVIGSLSTVWPLRNRKLLPLAQLSIFLKEAVNEVEAGLLVSATESDSSPVNASTARTSRHNTGRRAPRTKAPSLGNRP
jgi:DNA-binding IclR family transcriptional regulator